MSELQRLSAARNHFELFALPVRFTLDRKLLEQTYLELTRASHPDFAANDAASQLQAMQLSARINEAFATLCDDLKRAQYMMQLRGEPFADMRLAPTTLDRIFGLREALSQAQSNEDEQTARDLREQATTWLNELLAQIGQKLDAGESDDVLGQLMAAATYVKRITTA